MAWLNRFAEVMESRCLERSEIFAQGSAVWESSQQKTSMTSKLAKWTRCPTLVNVGHKTLEYVGHMVTPATKSRCVRASHDLFLVFFFFQGVGGRTPGAAIPTPVGAAYPGTWALRIARAATSGG